MLQDNRPLIIGITGSIGSGKTTFCKLLEQKFSIYYADILAHQALDSQYVKDSIKQRWGTRINAGETIDKKVIADIVFNDKVELEYLNSLLHPIVLSSMQDIVDTARDSEIFFEVPLLFEANLVECFDYIILITADEDIRKNRLLHSKKWSENQTNARIRNQLDDRIKALSSDYIIENNDSIDILMQQAEKFLVLLPDIPRKKIKKFSNYPTL